MKAIVLFVLTAIAALAGAGAATASAPGHAASSRPPCVPKYGSAKGHTYVDYCGPATATVTVGKKTYTFDNGWCGTDTKNHIQLQLQLGVIELVKSPVNGGQTQFSLTDIQDGSLGVTDVDADLGGKVLVNSGVTLKGAVKGTLTASGTFTSSAYASPTFSGTWNCHGVVFTQS
jgi:hypothetical protein